MSCPCKTDDTRRRLLVATTVLGGLSGAAATIPFVASLQPSEPAAEQGDVAEVDLAGLAPGQMWTVAWHGKPVWIVHRTQAMLDGLRQRTDALADPGSERSQQPASCRNVFRSLRPRILVVTGVCTHLGCSPNARFKPGAGEGMAADWTGGFLCPCHGSTFDLAGRVFKGGAAPSNLEIPPHHYLSETRLRIGEEQKVA